MTWYDAAQHGAASRIQSREKYYSRLEDRGIQNDRAGSGDSFDGEGSLREPKTKCKNRSKECGCSVA